VGGHVTYQDSEFLGAPTRSLICRDGRALAGGGVGAFRRSVPANYPIKLAVLPSIAAEVGPRAERVGLTVSGLLGALVWNDALAPNPRLQPLPGPAKRTREPVTCSLRRDLRPLAERRTLQLDMSLNAYLEALLEMDLRNPYAELTLLARAESKPGAKL